MELQTKMRLIIRMGIYFKFSISTLLTLLLFTQNARAEYSAKKVLDIQMGIHRDYAMVILDVKGAKPSSLWAITSEGLRLYLGKLQHTVDRGRMFTKTEPGAIGEVDIRENLDLSGPSFKFGHPSVQVIRLLLPSNPPWQGHYRTSIEFCRSVISGPIKTLPSFVHAGMKRPEETNTQKASSEVSLRSEVRKAELQPKSIETVSIREIARTSTQEIPIPRDKNSLMAQVALTTKAASELNTSEILRRADESRGNLKGVKWNVNIVSTEGDRTQERELEVKAKAYDFLAIFTAPPRVKGQKVLQVDRNMWFMKPGLSKAVPVSPRQRLLGSAAYGDIASTNYANDYEVIDVSEDAFDNEPCYLFVLKAIARNLTYDRVRYWVSKKRIVGVKAEFYTVSGKLIKSATFEYKNQVRVQEEDRPFVSSVSIKDHLLEGNLTIMRFSAYELVDIAPATFDLNLFMMR